MFTIPMVPLLNGPTTFIVSEIWNNPFWGVITPVYTHTRNGFVQKWVHIIAPNSKFKTEIWGAKPLDSHFIFEPWTSFLRLYLTCLFLDFTIFLDANRHRAGALCREAEAMHQHHTQQFWLGGLGQGHFECCNQNLSKSIWLYGFPKMGVPQVTMGFNAKMI